MSGWKIESLRFTAFISPGVSPDWSRWWQDVVSDVPEARVEKPREGTLREEGSFHSGRLVLAVEPLRVDWVFSGNTQDALQSGSLESLPDPAEYVPEFSALVKRWLSIGVPTVRLAWGAVLLVPVKNREDGYRKLATFLPDVTIDPVGSSDLMYQINRKRLSTVHGKLPINRLSKWSVSAIQAARLQIGQAPSGMSSLQTIGDSLHACRVELDVNTSPDNTVPFDTQVAVALLDEVVETASEIARKGDIP